MSDSYVVALLEELRCCEARNLSARVVAIKAELARFGVGVSSEPVVETASVVPAETARRGPGRPRKAD